MFTPSLEKPIKRCARGSRMAKSKAPAILLPLQRPATVLGRSVAFCPVGPLWVHHLHLLPLSAIALAIRC